MEQRTLLSWAVIHYVAEGSFTRPISEADFAFSAFFVRIGLTWKWAISKLERLLLVQATVAIINYDRNTLWSGFVSFPSKAKVFVTASHPPPLCPLV
jgi:hypothetical protein